MYDFSNFADYADKLRCIISREEIPVEKCSTCKYRMQGGLCDMDRLTADAAGTIELLCMLLESAMNGDEKK